LNLKTESKGVCSFLLFVVEMMFVMGVYFVGRIE